MGRCRVLGRPDLTTYANRFDVPEADRDLSVTLLGVSSLLIDDGESAVMTDGYSSRHLLLQGAAPTRLTRCRAD